MRLGREGAGLTQAKEGMWGEGPERKKDNEHDGVEGVSGACVSQGLSRNSVPGPLLVEIEGRGGGLCNVTFLSVLPTN